MGHAWWNKHVLIWKLKGGIKKEILEFDANSNGHIICYHINVLLLYLYATGQWYLYRAPALFKYISSNIR